MTPTDVTNAAGTDPIDFAAFTAQAHYLRADAIRRTGHAVWAALCRPHLWRSLPVRRDVGPASAR